MTLYAAYLTVLARVNTECYVHNDWVPSFNVTTCAQTLSPCYLYSMVGIFLSTFDGALFQLITLRPEKVEQ